MSVVGKGGFKETIVGWIPEEWDVTLLGRIAAIRKGKGSALQGKKCIELEHIESESGRIVGWDDGGSQSSIKTAFLKGDVLFGKLRPYLRKYAIAPFDGICTTEVLAIHPAEGRSLGRFLFYLMQGEGVFDTVNSLSYGTKMPRVSWSDLSELAVTVPSLPEQQKIAAVLTAVDEKLGVIVRQITVTQNLKQGLMQTLFSRGVGTQDASRRWVPHTAFKVSEFGLIPENWKCITLKIFCGGALQTGPFGSQLHAHEYQDKGVPVFMPKDLVSNRANKESAAKISLARAAELAKHKVAKGDLLFSRRGDVARFALIDEKSEGALCGTGCLKAKPTKEHSPSYLSHLLQLDTVKRWLEQNAVGQTMPNMNTRILSALPLVVPSTLAEEEEIAEILDGVDEKLKVLTTKQTYYYNLKRGLMQKLLTGEWRVKLDDVALAA